MVDGEGVDLRVFFLFTLLRALKLEKSDVLSNSNPSLILLAKINLYFVGLVW